MKRSILILLGLLAVSACGGSGGGGGTGGGGGPQAQACADLTALGAWRNTQAQETITLNADCTGSSNFQCPYKFTFTKPYAKQGTQEIFTMFTITEFSQTPGCPIQSTAAQEYQFTYAEPNLSLKNLSTSLVTSFRR